MDNIRQYICKHDPDAVVALAARYGQQISNDYDSCFRFLTLMMQHNQALAEQEMNSILPGAIYNREKVSVAVPEQKSDKDCGCLTKKYSNATGGDETDNTQGLINQVSSTIETKFNQLKDVYHSRSDSEKNLINMAAAFLAGMAFAHLFIKK